MDYGDGISPTNQDPSSNGPVGSVRARGIRAELAGGSDAVRRRHEAQRDMQDALRRQVEEKERQKAEEKRRRQEEEQREEERLKRQMEDERRALEESGDVRSTTSKQLNR